jgi:hypothetical protein
MTNSSSMTTSSPMTDTTVSRPANQVPPPGSNWRKVAEIADILRDTGEGVSKAASRGAQMAFLMSRAFGSDHASGSPPTANMHGE